MMPSMFAELPGTGLIAARGPDAQAFLHAQLTSDIAGLAELRTQYSGYCTPKGRLLATFLVWRLPQATLLQLPIELREQVQAQLKKYVLRAKVDLSDATADYRLFGAWENAENLLRPLAATLPSQVHEVVDADGVFITRIPGARFVLLAPASEASRVRESLASMTTPQSAQAWALSEIEAGIASVTTATRERFIPQMLNLDAIGAVSYAKGCYPGQEIVARTRYLGRLKQRLYPVRIASPEVMPGDSLYSEAFGTDQASGTVINSTPEDARASRALAVIQLAAAGEELKWRSSDGASVTVDQPPYPIPE